LAFGVAVLALALAGWAGVSASRDRPVLLRQLWGASVVEGAIVVEAVIALAAGLGGAAIR